MLNKKALAASLSAKETDADFKQTVLLLHGDGTNGAQNNTFTDSSTNAFTITRNGNTTQGTFSPFSQTGWSNYFDGSGDFLTLADSADWAFGSGDFTIECWVYNTGTDGFIAAQTNNSDAAGSAFVLYITSGALNALLYYGGGNFVSITDSASFPKNQWVHVALVRSSSTATLYVNGTSKGTGNLSTNSLNDVSSSLSIGARTSGSDPLTGYISNFRIVKGTAVYTAGFTVPTTPLTDITNTKLLTCQGNRFYDANTQVTAKTITVNGDTSVQAFSPFAPTDAYSAGTNGGSGYFDGSGDYLSVADATALDLGTGDFTIEGWVYMDSGIADNAGIVAKRPESTFNTGDWRISYRTATKKISFASDTTNQRSTPEVNVNGWVHFAFVRSGTTISCYANGARGDSVTDAVNLDNGNPVEIGRNSPSVSYTGYISGIRITKGGALYSGTTYTVPTAPFTTTVSSGSVSLLTNFTNAGIIDQTGKNNLETVGNAQIDTGTKKFGTGSLEFDGTGDYLKIPKSPNLVFGTGDFTIECWIYVSSNPAQYTNIVSNWEGSDPAWILNFSNASGNIRFNDNGNVYLTSSSALTTGQWNHVAVSRSGTSLKMFFNGTDVASATNSTSFGSASSGVFVGAYYDNTYPLTGFIDDLRITKGKARYTANFTAPTKAFADQ